MRVAIGVLATVLLAVGGCEYNYYGGCAEDGGCGMRGYDDRPRDHFGDDELDGGPQPDHGGVFADNAQIQGSDYLQMVRGPGALPINSIWPDVNPIDGKTLLDLQMRDGAPRVITVTLGQIGTYIGSWAVVPAWPRAEVVGVMEIGIGGMLFTAEVDFIEGTQFSIAVSKFKLSAVFRTLPGDLNAIPTLPAPPRVQVGASAALGVVAHGRAPQRTLTRVNAVAPINELWNIPHFAKSMRVVARRLPGFAPVLETDLLGTGGVASAMYVTAAPGGVEYPIEGDALGVQVTDVGAVATIQYSLIFDLAL